jgi:hypothetical protein
MQLGYYRLTTVQSNIIHIILLYIIITKKKIISLYRSPSLITPPIGRLQISQLIVFPIKTQNPILPTLYCIPFTEDVGNGRIY